MNPYTNLTEALTGLICQGYNANFNLENNCLSVRNHKYKVYADEFYIEDSISFEDPHQSTAVLFMLFTVLDIISKDWLKRARSFRQYLRVNKKN